MSGLVAARLFSLLPAFMPVQRKFDLVKSLWEAKCPHSHKTFYIGADADAQEVVALIKRNLEEVVQSYVIPETIAQRFRWLAQDDVGLQQELHNYFLQLNREVLSVATDDRIPRLLSTMRAEGVQKISQNIRIGNHQLDLVFDPTATGVSVERPKARITPSGAGCLVVIIIFGILVTVAAAKAMPSEWTAMPISAVQTTHVIRLPKLYLNTRRRRDFNLRHSEVIAFSRNVASSECPATNISQRSTFKHPCFQEGVVQNEAPIVNSP